MAYGPFLLTPHDPASEPHAKNRSVAGNGKIEVNLLVDMIEPTPTQSLLPILLILESPGRLLEDLCKVPGTAAKARHAGIMS